MSNEALSPEFIGFMVCLFLGVGTIVGSVIYAAYDSRRIKRIRTREEVEENFKHLFGRRR